MRQCKIDVREEAELYRAEKQKIYDRSLQVAGKSSEINCISDSELWYDVYVTDTDTGTRPKSSIFFPTLESVFCFL